MKKPYRSLRVWTINGLGYPQNKNSPVINGAVFVYDIPKDRYSLEEVETAIINFSQFLFYIGSASGFAL